MKLYSIKTNLSVEEAIAQAVAYFGINGLGLELTYQEECCVYFQGGGGYVTVTATGDEATKKVTLTLETREWDYHVGQFMRKIA